MNHPEWSFSNGGLGSSALNLAFASNGSGGQTMTNAGDAQCNGGANPVHCGFGYSPIKVGNRIVELAVKYYF
jgi:hypothetical protein